VLDEPHGAVAHLEVAACDRELLEVRELAEVARPRQEREGMEVLALHAREVLLRELVRALGHPRQVVHRREKIERGRGCIFELAGAQNGMRVLRSGGVYGLEKKLVRVGLRSRGRKRAELRVLRLGERRREVSETADLAELGELLDSEVQLREQVVLVVEPGDLEAPGREEPRNALAPRDLDVGHRVRRAELSGCSRDGRPDHFSVVVGG